MAMYDAQECAQKHVVEHGEDFYGMYDAQECAQKHAPELGMQTVPSMDVVYTEEQGYVTADVVSVSGCMGIDVVCLSMGMSSARSRAT
eukprot:867223-Pelagomonas_calceolata.AAC.4